MVDAELFATLAEIAGVFVGFGALIAVRSKDASDAHTVEYLRGTVAGGLLVVVAALAPLVVSRFQVEGHAVWLSCSVFFLVVFLIFWISDARSTENRTERRVNRRLTLRYAAVGLPMTLVMTGSLILIIVGAWPQHEAALYFLAVTVWLVEVGFGLIWLVWTHDSAVRPESEPRISRR